MAGAGFGKSTLLAVWATQNGSAWYTVTSADRDLATMAAGLTSALALRAPALSLAMAGVVDWTLGPDAAGDERSRARACAGLIADALASAMRRDLAIVIDDLHEIGPTDPGASLIEALCRQAPARLHIVLASRDPLPFSVERLRGQGHLAALTGQQLGFDRDETAAVVNAADELAGDDALVDAVPARDRRLAGGGPAGSRGPPRDPAAGRRSVLERVLRPSGAIYAYLAEEVLGREPAAIRELLRAVAPLPRFNAALCEAIGIAGAEETIRSLEDRGLFVQPSGRATGTACTRSSAITCCSASHRRPEDAPRTREAPPPGSRRTARFATRFTCWEAIGDTRGPRRRPAAATARR